MVKNDKYSRFTMYVNNEDELILNFLKAQNSFSTSMRLVIWALASQLKNRPDLSKDVSSLDMFQLIDVTKLENWEKLYDR